jgi:outer membrane protein assembly factor BamB
MSAKRLLTAVRWAEDDEPEEVSVALDMPSDSPVAFGADFSMRERGGGSTHSSAVEKNDLHSLLVRGSFRLRVGESRREVPEAFVFLVAETLLREAQEILQAFCESRALYHRFETAGVCLGFRLTSDGTLSLTFGAPKSGGLRNAVTFPSVAVPSFVEAVLSFGRSLSRAMTRHDRGQANNLRMRAIRDFCRDLEDELQESVRNDAKYNEAPETYRAFADSIPSQRPVSKSGAGLSRIRFSPSWQATVPGIDLHATFLMGERLVVGGARDLACIEKGSGQLIWRVPVDRGVCVATPSGVARLAPDGLVTMHALETGVVNMKLRLAARVGGSPAGAVVNSPGLPKLLVVSEGERHITALDLVSGEVRWRHALGRGRSFKVRRAGRLLVVSTGEAVLSALDATSGEAVWRVRAKQRFCRPGAYDANDLFVVTGEVAPIWKGNELLNALDPWTGQTRWSTELPGGKRTVGAPLVSENMVVSVTQDHRGTGFVGVDRRDGSIKWSIENGFTPSTCAWLVVDETLIVNGSNGAAAAIDLASGITKWRQQFECNCEGDVPRQLDPILRGGVLFIPQRFVSVVRPGDGETLGRVPADLVPDLIRVDEDCNTIVVEESGHVAAFAAGARLSLVKG